MCRALFALLLFVCGSVLSAQERVAWTSSRLHGSPEPPPKYHTVNAYPKLSFHQPTVLTSAPGTTRLFLAEQAGKIVSFPDDPDVASADPFLDLKTELKTIPDDGSTTGMGNAYGMAFHPRYPEVPHVFICYTLNPKDAANRPLLDGTRVSRFEVAQTDPPRADPASERIVITWREGGHNGGCLKFGPDGFLYISTGDATPPNPPDELKAGQDVSNLLSCILRIDVDQTSEDRAYAIPPDNPFVALPNARPEIWSYGFRNPWKMSFDRETGELWVGDVGWELWEMIYRIEKGGNYGWSITEGPQIVDPQGPRGPTPILPPALSLPHSISSSVTGGFVYRGTKFPELRGQYLFGDFDTRGLWGVDAGQSPLGEFTALTPPEHRIVAFGEKNDGELLIVDYSDGTLNRLERREIDVPAEPFPVRLSETNLFRDPVAQQPTPGVYEFDIAEPMWMDGATARYFVGLPGDAMVKWYPSRRGIPGTSAQAELFFPPEGVLAKTISIDTAAGPRKLETQVLHHDGRYWRGYTYRWNDEQTDADLVPADGATTILSVPDPDAPEGIRELRWTFHGRNQCLRCHNTWNEFALAFNVAQLNRPFAADPSRSQLDWLHDLGLLTKVTEEDGRALRWPDPAATKRLLTESDEDTNAEALARTYLHVNCAHCHQNGAGGTATFDVRYDRTMSGMNLVDAPPMQGSFGIDGAKLVTPGDPHGSVLYYRMLKTGSGHMPHIGAERVDHRGLKLISDWILELPRGWRERELVDRLTALVEKPADAGQAAEVVRQLLATHRGRVFLAEELPWLRKRATALADAVVARVLELDDPAVRQLFARYLPGSAQQATLGADVRLDELLALTGDVTRGEQVFHNEKLAQCGRCHTVGDRGGKVGPALDDVGRRLKPAELVEALLQPSRKIDPKYQTWLLITSDGKVATGLLQEKTDRQVVLIQADGKPFTAAAEEVDALQPQNVSLMPDQLLRDLTAQQAGDLLAFLRSLQRAPAEPCAPVSP